MMIVIIQFDSIDTSNRTIITFKDDKDDPVIPLITCYELMLI